MWSGAPHCHTRMSAFGKFAWLICVGSIVALWYYQWQPAETPPSFIAFLDVGQGDASYVRTANGADVFMDGGPDRTILERAPEVMQPFDDTIELLILTHPDADHITGIVELVKRYEVKQIITTALSATKSAHVELLELIEQQQIDHQIVSAGDRVAFDETSYLEILYPSDSTALTALETNNTSLIAEYHHGSGDNELVMLFTGDIEAEVEAVLVQQQLVQDIDVLKVPHHGSNSSSTAEFLAAIVPEVCIIEVGQDNQYGHPRQEVIDRLSPYCQIRRTDQEGTIIIPL